MVLETVLWVVWESHPLSCFFFCFFQVFLLSTTTRTSFSSSSYSVSDPSDTGHGLFLEVQWVQCFHRTHNVCFSVSTLSVRFLLRTTVLYLHLYLHLLFCLPSSPKCPTLVVCASLISTILCYILFINSNSAFLQRFISTFRPSISPFLRNLFSSSW